MSDLSLFLKLLMSDLSLFLESLILNLSLMLKLSDPPQCYNATGHLVDSRAKNLTAPWTHGMASTRCMHKSKSQVCNAALGSTRYVS